MAFVKEDHLFSQAILEVVQQNNFLLNVKVRRTYS